MKSIGNGLIGAVLLAGLTAVQPVPPGCFWTGVAWACWTHPLFPDVTLVPEGDPYGPWVQTWGGPGWRFYGWLRM
jgi:hypothetical protein